MTQLRTVDGTEFDPDEIVSGGSSQEDLADDSAAGWSSELGDAAPEGVMLGCPPPSKWHQVGSPQTVRGTTFHLASPVYGPSVVDKEIELVTDRSVTTTASVEARGGVTIGILELDAHVKLERSVTTRTQERIKFHLPKGMSVVAKVQFIYHRTEFQRDIFGGPNCRPAPEAASVLTPVDYAVVIVKA